ncbi:MAG: hypothetical protein GY856_41315 [bacterium]|nr:hypothetical protein [bacterium]
MRTIEALAEIAPDGTLTARLPGLGPRGKTRVVIVVDDAEVDDRGPRRRLPDLSEFRAKLSCKPYPGNSVVDMRMRERG